MEVPSGTGPMNRTPRFNENTPKDKPGWNADCGATLQHQLKFQGTAFLGRDVRGDTR
jgi:hypothetical protein